MGISSLSLVFLQDFVYVVFFFALTHLITHETRIGMRGALGSPASWEGGHPSHMEFGAFGPSRAGTMPALAGS